MTLGKVSDYQKFTGRAIYRLAGVKQILAFKVGGSWRFSKADIEGWTKCQSMEVGTGTGHEDGQGSTLAQVSLGKD
jgi:hypothetical protein